MKQGLLLGSILFVAILLAAIYGSRKAGSAAAPSEEGIVSIIKSDWYCSPGSEDEAAQLNLALARQDLKAAAGIVERNRAFNLSAHTSVRIILRGGSGLALVRVTSGYHDGQSCWIPSTLLF